MDHRNLLFNETSESLGAEFQHKALRLNHNEIRVKWHLSRHEIHLKITNPIWLLPKLYDIDTYSASFHHNKIECHIKRILNFKRSRWIISWIWLSNEALCEWSAWLSGFNQDMKLKSREKSFFDEMVNDCVQKREIARCAQHKTSIETTNHEPLQCNFNAILVVVSFAGQMQPTTCSLNWKTRHVKMRRNVTILKCCVHSSFHPKQQ